MIVTNPSAFVPESPSIDIGETRWVSAELSSLIARLGPDSPVSLVLRQARRELTSLALSGHSTVVGPLRVAA